MIQIRDVLQVKFGKIDQAVDLLSQPSSAPAGLIVPGDHYELLTDISGSMYTLVASYLAENLAVYEARRDAQFQEPEFDAWFKQFQLFVDGGRREVYNVEGAYQSWSRPGCVVVRECYRAYKWQIRQAVALLQRYGALMAALEVGQNPRILTDAAGPMFQAVIEIETESLSAWEAQRRSLFQQVEFQVWFNQLLTTVEAGSHEFYRVEYVGK